MFGRFAEEVAPPAHDRVKRHDELFAQRVNRRVRDLREKLAEIRVQQPRLEREHGQRGVVAHGAERFRAVAQHGLEDHVEFLARVAEGHLTFGEREDVEFVGGLGHFVARGEAVEADQIIIEPLFVRTLGGEPRLDVGVAQQASVFGVDRDHLARPEPTFFDDLGIVEVDRTHLRAEGENAVLGQLVARGAQAVAVQARADRAVRR